MNSKKLVQIFIAIVIVVMSVSAFAMQSAKSVWDGVYTADQAARGQKSYEAECARCHELGSFSGKQFMDSWKGQTAGDLFENISSSMPMDAPGKLDKQGYADIISYFFKLQQFPTGQNEMQGDVAALKQIKIEPKPAH